VHEKAEVNFADFLLQTNSLKLAKMSFGEPTSFTSAIWINVYKQISLTNCFVQKVCQAIFWKVYAQEFRRISFKKRRKSMSKCLSA
jgi:hypothetical protein